ncbi:MAG: hypothetical protein ACFFER_11565 [Candidatus Thorarchaeota archaeon]
MSQWVVRAKVIGFSMMILIGGTVTVAFLGYSYYSYSYSEQTELYPFSFAVTSEVPQWSRQTDRYFVSRISITNLETNGTPVNLLYLKPDGQVALFLTNVSKISDIAVTSYITRDSSIIVERIDNDAEVNLTILEFLEIPPPPIDNISPLPAIIFWWAFATAGFLMLVFMKVNRNKARQSTGMWQNLRHIIHPAWIGLLVLLSIILMFPYITGSLEGAFIPAERDESFDTGSQSFTLNSANPIDYLEIGAGIEDTSYRFTISPHDNPDMRYQMAIQDSLEHILLNATFINETAAWQIEGSTTAGTNYTLMLERSGSNVEIGFSYDLIRTVIRPDKDSTISTYEAIVGVGILMLAIIFGLIIEVDDEMLQS